MPVRVRGDLIILMYSNDYDFFLFLEPLSSSAGFCRDRSGLGQAGLNTWRSSGCDLTTYLPVELPVLQ